MKSAELIKLKTFGELKAAGYKSVSVKEELRQNLIHSIKEQADLFPGVKGYEDTVMPQVESALLAKHNILLLGLRGQAKTRIARQMTDLLDEWVPVIAGSEIQDDPFQPLSVFGKEMIATMGDQTAITWLHRDNRYTEKLATPDVSVADLIGDLDPIKAAANKWSYADERAIHFGLIPRANRGVFVINELPDLQARIQVALFNILQEGDIQIRGFKVRMPLDIVFVFTANPEDYTNRGSIITPLKDRIQSQILTHYPKSIETAKAITEQEAAVSEEVKAKVVVPELLKILIEQIAFEARASEYVDQKSGVSARLTISAMELLYAVAERRMLLNGETSTVARIQDLYGVLPALSGKMELVYEGENEGMANVARFILGKSLRNEFEHFFPNPEKIKKAKGKIEPIFDAITTWFGEGHQVDIGQNFSDKEYRENLMQVPTLKQTVEKMVPNKGQDQNRIYVFMEFLLHGLAEYSQLSKQLLDKQTSFRDLVGSMFSMGSEEEEER
jgi:magnesium chelatase subunit I